MPLVLLLLVLAVLAAVAVVATGWGGTLTETETDRSPRGLLPPGPIGPEELEELRFSLGFRGYRMDEVDAVIDRLVAELAQRDERIAELERPAQPSGRDDEPPPRPGG